MYKRYKYVVSIYGGGVLVVIAKKGYDEGGQGRGPATARHLCTLFHSRERLTYHNLPVFFTNITCKHVCVYNIYVYICMFDSTHVW